MKSVEDERAALAEALGRMSNACFFTGAGISTPSGIPDFRSPGGIWSQYRIVEIDEFCNDEEARMEDWTRRFHMYEHFNGAKPNAAHMLIAKMVANARACGVITQNIDGLHGKSGIPADQIVEFHGTGDHAHCLQCRTRYEILDMQKRIQETGEAPRCSCGGLIKAAVISFGEAIPEDNMRRAAAMVEECDAMVVMGSSLLVWPASGFVEFVLKRGMDVIILNRDETPFDAAAKVCIRGDLATVCAGIPEELGF